ncbi:hypothetical protein MHYP_G00278360 [Metynnis hypsauchen]
MPTNNPDSVASIKAMETKQTANASKASEGAALGTDNPVVTDGSHAISDTILAAIDKMKLRVFHQEVKGVRQGEAMAPVTGATIRNDSSCKTTGDIRGTATHLRQSWRN